MAEKEIMFETQESPGAIKIANEVILTIAAQALHEIKGITLAVSAAEGFVDKLVKKPSSKGVRIYLNEDAKEVDIDVHVAISYGINIPEISWEIQEAVKKTVETMTDVTVNKVNVFVDGVTIEKEPKPEKPKKAKADKKSAAKAASDNTAPVLEDVLSDDSDEPLGV